MLRIIFLKLYSALSTTDHNRSTLSQADRFEVAIKNIKNFSDQTNRH